VVGPNGSGKSNVIDAMLFVFGKRAKQLRLSKVHPTLPLDKRARAPLSLYTQRQPFAMHLEKTIVAVVLHILVGVSASV